MNQETQIVPYRRNLQDLLCDSGQLVFLDLIITHIVSPQSFL